MPYFTTYFRGEKNRQKKKRGASFAAVITVNGIGFIVITKRNGAGISTMEDVMWYLRVGVRRATNDVKERTFLHLLGDSR